jgi:predicted Rossmann fold flavoprotein
MSGVMAVETFDAVVIGAGAAGLFCAAIAGRRGRRVVVLDHAPEAGRKILISGGGRCNFTNLDVTAANFLSDNPHFCKSALAGFSQHDFVALVRAHGIAFHEKHLGQLFCDGSAREIVAMLLAMCAAAGVEVRLGQRVSDVSKADHFTVRTEAGEVAAENLVLATGGLSIPKLGATGFAYDVAKKFGLGVTPVQAGLVPLVFADAGWMQGLSGVSFDAVASCGKAAFREHALFTHRGMSGPAILQISSYWREGDGIELNMLPGVDVYAWLLERKAARPKAALKTVLAEMLPARLAAHLAGEGRVIGEAGNKALQALAASIGRFALRPSGSEGFAKAEVTAGGVATSDLSSKTMEALRVKGLFVIGEAVDVTGWLGGYNFQWAWSSGYAAGRAV